jgi:hypothetical protein
LRNSLVVTPANKIATSLFSLILGCIHCTRMRISQRNREPNSTLAVGRLWHVIWHDWAAFVTPTNESFRSFLRSTARCCPSRVSVHKRSSCSANNYRHLCKHHTLSPRHH